MTRTISCFFTSQLMWLKHGIININTGSVTPILAPYCNASMDYPAIMEEEIELTAKIQKPVLNILPLNSNLRVPDETCANATGTIK